MNSIPHESLCVDKALLSICLKRSWLLNILLTYLICFSGSLLAGGLTILTHGYQNEDPSDEPERLVWLDAMTDYVHDKTALKGAVYELVIDKPGGVLRSQLNYIKGPKLDDSANTSGEVIIKLNWALAAGLIGGDEATTVEIAAAAFDQLMNWTDGSSPLGGPIHLIGHSRGGSVVCELAKQLGTQGLWVDHLTTLDPHPVPLRGDSIPKIWENVNFADNYYQKYSIGLNGQFLDGAYNSDISERIMLGGYTGISDLPFRYHSNIHVWYHGTLNTDRLSVNGRDASNGDVTISEVTRHVWYLPTESLGTRTGYYLSRLGGGMSQRSDATFKDGLFDNASGLPLNRYGGNIGNVVTRTRPNIISTNTTAPTRTGPFTTIVRYQDYDSAATITVHIDNDRNPHNNFYDFLKPSLAWKTRKSQAVLRTGSLALTATLNWTNSDVPTGDYWVNTEITDGQHTRSFYSETKISITNTGTPPVEVTAPAAPSNLQALALSTSSISLSWQDNSNNETAFRIQRRLGSSGSWSALTGQTADKPAGTRSLTDKAGLSPGATYQYRVAAINSANTANPAYAPAVSVTTLSGPPPQRQLSVTSINPFTGISFTVSPTAVSSPSSGVFNYAHGTEVTLTAPSTSPNGNVFLRWEKDGLPFVTTQSATVLMDGNHQMSIIYGVPTVTPAYTVSLASEPIAGGRVTGDGVFGVGALVTAQAVPNTGYRFVNWTAAGQVFSLSPNPSFQVTGNMSLVANFAPAIGTHTITATSNPLAGGTTSGAGSYSNGDMVTLNATPADGWLFGTWTENGTVIGFTSNLVFPAYQSRELQATFTPDVSKNYYLSITSENGTAIRTPNQTAYAPGSTVSVKATPAVGYYFSGWSGAAAGTENPLTVTMTANKSLIANFTSAPPNTYTLSVNTSSRGSVSKSPDQAFYNAGSVVTLTATPTAGNAFAGWRRGAFGITNPVQVTMDADKLIAPNFIPTSASSSRLTISTPFSVNVGYQAGDNSSASYSVSNTGSGTMYYHGTATVNWLQVNSGGTPVSGGGSSGLAISWEENTSFSPRTGEVWVYAPGAQNSPQIYTITQAAGVPKFALAVEAINGAVKRTPEAATYSSGSSVVLSAEPIAGYTFAGWTGDANGTLNPVTVVMAAPRSITATFARLPASDLKLEFNLASNTVIAGLNADVTGKIKNIGADASTACRTYFRLSSSATVPPSIAAGEAPFIDVGSLAVNAQQSTSTTVAVDANLAAGTYYMWALVDPEFSGNEQSTARTNNQIVTSVLVVPDTMPPAISIASPAMPVTSATSTAFSLSGTASDNVGVSQVTWVNNRGGSGTATGTTAWSIVGVSLADGENVINVTAADVEGNHSTDMVTVVNYLADQTPPSINISFPTALGATDIEGGKISLGGQANDGGSSLASVSWSNDRGGSGACVGKETWSVADISLLPGINTIIVTATDRAGNQGTASMAVNAIIVPASADSKRPSITITAPAVNGRIEGSGFTVSGTASAKLGVQSILYKLDDGAWTEHLVGGAAKTAWSISSPSPTYGTHAIYVRSKDAEGYLSPINSRTFVFVIRSNLILTVSGPGAVKYGGFTSTTGLEVGKNYTLTAKSNAGAIFAGWSGGIVSAVPAINFTMQEGLEVMATFVGNPFSTVAGAYLGLARGETDDHATSGLLRSTVTTAGSFSGTLLLGGKSYSLTGKFDSNGQWAGQIIRSKQVPLSLLLKLDVAGGSDTLTGLVSDGAVTAAIQTDRATFNAKTNAAPSMGRYTFVIEPEIGDATAPGGFSAGTLVVDGAGKVTLTGKLAETTGLSMTSQVAKDGRWPLHVLLYSSTGSITGEMLFANLSESDALGGLFWFKPVRTKDSYFKNGFSTQPSLVAQRYTPPAKGVRILTGWDASSGAGLLTADSADLPSALSQPVIWTTANLIQSDQAILPGLKVTPVISSGLFSGSFLHPTTRKSMTFSGVLLQNTHEGLGWFQGTTSTGSVILKKAPAP